MRPATQPVPSARVRADPASSKGRTEDFESSNRGSNPRAGTRSLRHRLEPDLAVLHDDLEVDLLAGVLVLQPLAHVAQALRDRLEGHARRLVVLAARLEVALVHAAVLDLGRYCARRARGGVLRAREGRRGLRE